MAKQHEVPSTDDIFLSAEWLDENEGSPDEREPMRRVAAWLRELAQRKEKNEAIHRVAEATGCSVPIARKAYAREAAKVTAAMKAAGRLTPTKGKVA